MENMRELLEEALREYEAQRAAVTARDDSPEIEQKVAEYENKLKAEAADKKAAELAEIDISIRAVENLKRKVPAEQDCSVASESVCAMQE